MPFFQNILGTSSLLFRLGVGSTGLYWKNDGASRILARNGADSDYVKVAGLDPTAAQDFVTLSYLGSASIGSYHTACRVASTANIAALTGLLTIDSVVLVAGDRVLVKDQSTASQNGVYVAAAGAWARAADFAAASVQAPMQAFPVSEGTVWADSVFVLTTNAPITVGVTSTVFQEQGPVFRSGTAQPLAARINRGALSAPIDATKLGVVSLGSQSSFGGTGVLSNYGACGGGDRNLVGSAADYSSVCGGLTNSVLATHSVVAGGQNNIINTTATHSAIGGGSGNSISAAAIFCAIAGGTNNTCAQDRSFVGGGDGNIAGDATNAGSSHSSVVGGSGNQALGLRDVVCGGQGNLTGIAGAGEARTEYAFIGSGDGNRIRRPTTGTPSSGTTAIRWSGIVSGRLSTIRRDYGFIHGESCEVGNDNATTYGFGTHGFVHGILGYSQMDGQYVHGSTGGTQYTSGLGGAQYSRTQLAGLSTGGVGVTLRPQGQGTATNTLRLEANRAYQITVRAVAKTATGVGDAKFFYDVLLVQVDNAGTPTIVSGPTSLASGGTGGAATWTLGYASGGATSFRLDITFTGTGTTRCLATVEMVELIFA